MAVPPSRLNKKGVAVRASTVHLNRVHMSSGGLGLLDAVVAVATADISTVEVGVTHVEVVAVLAGAACGRCMDVITG